MKPHKLILIALFFAILKQISCEGIYANKELCKLYEPETDQTITQALTATPIYISQSTCVQRFTLDFKDLMQRWLGYIYIEVQFDPFPDPSPKFSMMLLEGDYEHPTMYYSENDKSIHKAATYDDSDAYVNHKTFHRISLDAIYSFDRRRYFAVYKLFEDLGHYQDNSHVVSYNIRVRVVTDTMEFQCLNNCSGHGVCDLNVRQCVCHAGFFDSDCSVKAHRLSSGIPQSQPVPAKSSAYYYTPFQNQMDVFTFSFQVDKPEWNFAVQFNYPKDFLINSGHAVQFTNPYPLSVLETSKEYSSKAIPKLATYFSGNILVFVSNPTNNPMYSTVQVDIQGKEKSKLLLFIAIMAGVVLFLMVIGAFIIKKCRARAARSARNIELEEVQGNIQEQEHVFLTKEEIEKYFPLKQFSDVKTGFLQSTCSICLEEFTADSRCHQLYCQHIFHDHCIESWLAKQSNCPNCKSEMNKDFIENFLKSQKSSKFKKNKPQSQQIDHKNEQSEQPDRGNIENSVYENSEENPIELQSPIGSPLTSPRSARMLVGSRDKYAPNI